MKHKLSFIVALWWVILCLIGGVFLLGTSDKQPRLSESENRMLAGFPKLSAASLASGEFMTGFESFLSDAFFGRDALVRTSDRLLGAADAGALIDEAKYYKDSVFSVMNELRAVVDETELLMPTDAWPYPTYGKLLFDVR